jgi:excinuclease ABC subunit B
MQTEYNQMHGITPTPIIKSTSEILGQTSVVDVKKPQSNYYVEKEEIEVAADPLVKYLNKEQIQKIIQQTRKNMEAAVKELDFINAARFRDEINQLKQLLETK